MSDTAYPVTTSLPDWNSAMASAADGFQACAGACIGWQQEMVRFLDLRIAGNHQSWSALLSARDAAGLVKVQQEWAVQAAADYAAEATRLARLVTTLSLTGTTPEVQSAAAVIA